MKLPKEIKRSVAVQAAIALILSVPALIIIAVGVFINIDTMREMENMVKTTATVTRVEAELTHRFDDDPDDNGVYEYTTYVEYSYNGEMIEVMSDVGDDNLSKGDVIDFWYDPEDPEHVSAGLAATNKLILPFILIGADMFGAPALIFIFSIINTIRRYKAGSYNDMEADYYIK